MLYFILSLGLISICVVLWSLHKNRGKKRNSIHILKDISFETPGYEIPILISVDAQSDLDVVENLIYDVGFKVLSERNESIKRKPVIRYRTFNETCIEFIVILKIKSLSDKNSIKQEFIRLLKKRFFQNGILVPYPNCTDLYIIS